MLKPYKIPQTKPFFVFNGAEFSDLDKQIKAIEDEFRVKEIDITFKEERLILSDIQTSADAHAFVKEVIADGIEIQEHFIVLYMNHANKVIGYYKHTKGTINSTQVDIEMIVAVGLKVLAKAVILSHNHPSGNTTPSKADHDLTRRIKTAFKYFNISILDHIIVTKNDYYSFSDNNDASLSGTQKAEMSETANKLREEILRQLKKVTQANSPIIWQSIQTSEGYKKIEQKIIERVISQNLIPAAVIPQMESEMTME